MMIYSSHYSVSNIKLAAIDGTVCVPCHCQMMVWVFARIIILYKDTCMFAGGETLSIKRLNRSLLHVMICLLKKTPRIFCSWSEYMYWMFAGFSILCTDTFGRVDILCIKYLLIYLQGDKNHDTWIFTLAILLSSTFVYNSQGTIDQNAIDGLQYPVGRPFTFYILHFIVKVIYKFEVSVCDAACQRSKKPYF